MHWKQPYQMSGMWVGIEKKAQKCCCLSWQWIVGQLDCDNSTVDKLYRLYGDCKDKSSVKDNYILRRVIRCRTTLLIGYHTCMCMYRVRVRVCICICSQCACNAGCQVVYSPTKRLTSHFEANLVPSLYLPKIHRVIGIVRHLRNAGSM